MTLLPVAIQLTLEIIWRSIHCVQESKNVSFAFCSFIVSGKHSKATCVVTGTQLPNQLCKIHLLISQHGSCFNTVTFKIWYDLSLYIVFLFVFKKWKVISVFVNVFLCTSTSQNRACFLQTWLNTFDYYWRSVSVMCQRPLVGSCWRPEVLYGVTKLMNSSFNREQSQVAQWLIDWRDQKRREGGRESERTPNHMSVGWPTIYSDH